MKKASLQALITHNLGLKSLALLAAVGLWFNIASEPEVATAVTIPVDYRNFPRDLVISSNIVDTVTVEARGAASRLREMQESHVAATIDFASVHAPGERTFTLTDAEIRPPRGVTVVRAIPEQLRFRFERQVKGNVPVDVIYSGELPRGLRLDGVTVSPSELEITGPASRVAEAHTALTDPFDLSRVTGDSQQQLSAYISDPELRFAGAPRVTVKIHVERNQ